MPSVLASCRLFLAASNAHQPSADAGQSSGKPHNTHLLPHLPPPKPLHPLLLSWRSTFFHQPSAEP